MIPCLQFLFLYSLYHNFYIMQLMVLLNVACHRGSLVVRLVKCSGSKLLQLAGLVKGEDKICQPSDRDIFWFMTLIYQHPSLRT